MLCSQRTVGPLTGPQRIAGRALRSLSFPKDRVRIPDYRLPTGCYVHIRCVYTAVLDGATSRTDTVGVPCLYPAGAGGVGGAGVVTRLRSSVLYVINSFVIENEIIR